MIFGNFNSRENSLELAKFIFTTFVTKINHDKKSYINFVSYNLIFGLSRFSKREKA
jgi:hypothetical protein